MSVSERQNQIVRYLQDNSSASVRTLASRFFVSEATVRRDLAEMHRLGLIDRKRGGAALPDGAGEISMFVRVAKNAKEKEKTAENALKILPPFKTAFIDSSSTALALARRIDFRGKTVITHSLQAATAVSKQRGAEVVLLGGSLLYNMTSVSGSWTIAQISEFSFDLSVTSCAALSAEGAFERTMEQRDIKRAAFARSKANILLADSTKFSCAAPFKSASPDFFDFVVSDAPPPENFSFTEKKAFSSAFLSGDLSRKDEENGKKNIRFYYA